MLSIERLSRPVPPRRRLWDRRTKARHACLCLPALLLAAAALLILPQPALAAPPEAPAGAWRVVVDAGHGGGDPGTISPFAPLVEKDVVLQLARLTAAALQRRGIGVVHTRSDDAAVPLAQRAALAQRSGAQALISLHLNSAPDRSASGVEAWYGSSPRHADLAGALLETLTPTLRAYGMPVRGTRSGPHLAVLRTPVPAALVELGYVSNARDAALLAQPAFLQAVAEALASGVVRFRDAAASPATAGRPLLPDVYFVRPGDTLGSIAARFRLAAEEVIRLNPLADPNRLLPGHPVQLRPVESLVASWSAPAGQASPAPRRRIVASSAGTYTVAPGDTLSEIALATGVGQAELRRLNGLTDPHTIRAGQTLRLRPDGAAATPAGQAGGAERRYTVVPGDTLSEIAARFDVSTAALARRNDLADPDRLRVGSVLIVPQGS